MVQAGRVIPATAATCPRLYRDVTLHPTRLDLTPAGEQARDPTKSHIRIRRVAVRAVGQTVEVRRGGNPNS
jgi:hypothetical protein